MLAVWRLGSRASIPEIIDTLGEDPPPTFGKIRSFLRRIEKKGYVESEEARDELAQNDEEETEPRGRGRPIARHYIPLVGREETVRAEVRWFLEERLAGEPELLKLMQEELEAHHPGRGLKAARFRPRRSSNG